MALARKGRPPSREWCSCGALDSLRDPNGNLTTWERDVQGRTTRETRANGSFRPTGGPDLAGLVNTARRGRQANADRCARGERCALRIADLCSREVR